MLRLALALILFAAGTVPSLAEAQVRATMYKRPYCGCCEGHADHLRANGFDLTVVEADNLPAIKKKYRVPPEFEGCHTLVVDGYVVEGHVPATVIRKLLKERTAIRGISLPGMPEGSPGMGGKKSGPFVIYELSDKTGAVFATE